MRSNVLDAIQNDDTLRAILQQQLWEGHDLNDAIGLTIQESHEANPDADWIEQAASNQQNLDNFLLADAWATTGLSASTNTSNRVEVNDVSAFSKALQGVHIPTHTQAAGELRDHLDETIANMLFRTAIAAKETPPATPAELPDIRIPQTLIDIALTSEDEIRELNEAINPGPDFLQDVIDNSTRLAQSSQTLGLQPSYTRGLAHLGLAASEGVTREWAEAHDMGLYDNTHVGSIHALEGRFTTAEESDHVITYIQHLQETIPDTAFTRQTTRALLADLQAAIQAPFDPDEGGPMMQTEVTLHDQDHGRIPTTEPQPMGIDAALENILLGANTANDADDEWGDFGPILPPEMASAEESSRVRQEMRDDMVELLTTTRDGVLAVIPSSERERFANRAATNEMSDASVGNIAMVILAQEVLLQGTVQELATAKTLITNVQEAISGALRGTQHDNAISILNALTTALEHLKTGHTLITTGSEHLKDYQP
jgi:hypothetical protein